MHPSFLSPDDTESLAEVEVHALLAEAMPDEWEIFHSAGLVLRDDTRGAFNDEVDFVLAHPDEGVICLEVKGGHFELEDGRFIRVRRSGQREPMPHPYRQAINHWHNFRRLLNRLSSGRARSWFVTWAIAFPDEDLRGDDLTPEGPRQLTLDRAECNGDIRGALERANTFHRAAREKRVPLGTSGVALIREHLSPTIRFGETLGGGIAEDDRFIERLTDRQSRLLRGLRWAPRVSVTGMAGTGKTVLASERCRDLCEQGREVAYVCFTRGLAEDMRQQSRAPTGVTTTFHKLCADKAREHAIKLPLAGRANPPAEHWSTHLPDALVAACEQTGGFFDDIVVDEAQDLTNDYLAALMFTLRDEDEGSIWIFGDDNQKVFGRGLDIPPEFVRYELSENFRNTQSIHSHLVEMYHGASRPICIGPVGRPLDWVEHDDTVAGLRQQLERLLSDERVHADDIVVLSPFPLERSRSASGNSPAFRFWSSNGRAPKAAGDSRSAIRFESIKAFKGLEAPVVLLCDVDHCLGRDDGEAEFYVGLSRGRAHCLVVGSPGSRRRFEALYEAGEARPSSSGGSAEAGETLMRVYEIAQAEGLPDSVVLRRLRKAGFHIESSGSLIDKGVATAALFPDRESAGP